MNNNKITNKENGKVVIEVIRFDCELTNQSIEIRRIEKTPVIQF